MKPPRISRRLNCGRAAGFFLLEGLAAILVFSFGVMGILTLQANSIGTVRDAKFRSDAGLLANRIIGQMWVNRGDLGAYALNAGSAACTDGNNASSNARVQAWLDDMASVLPSTSNLRQQISVSAGNVVQVTICWKTPQDVSPAFRRHVATAQIQG